MRVWFDTEFIEDGRTIDLISIGMVRQDGALYYAEVEETDMSRASSWVRENVLPRLTGPRKPRAVIAQEVVEFCRAEPEFWAYYASYDWVALTGTIAHPAEIEAIMKLDRAWLAAQAEHALTWMGRTDHRSD